MIRSTKYFIAGGLIVALVLAFGISRFASSAPDGLNRVAADQGFNDHEGPHAMDDSPFAGYDTAGIHDAGMSTGVAGLLGVTATFVLAGAAVWAASKIRRTRVDALP